MNLDELWTYVPPTPEKQTAYDIVRRVEAKCRDAVYVALFRSDGVRLMGERYKMVNEGTLELARIIEDHAPASADRTTAIRLLRLARMEANEILSGPMLFDPIGCQVASDRWAHIEAMIRHARFWACSAIALDGKA